jgi:hypothetical protein
VHADVRLKGTPLSPGIAIGRTCFYRREASDPDLVLHNDHRHEAFRLRQTVGDATDTLCTQIYGQIPSPVPSRLFIDSSESSVPIRRSLNCARQSYR